MKVRTFYRVLLLFLAINLLSCGSKNPAATPLTVEQAEKEMAKKKKKQAKLAKREQKKAYKHYWSLQTKEAKKSIKKNRKRQKRIAKRRKKAGGAVNHY